MILLTGATGYVGGRLLRRLEREGYPVRCLCRNPETLLCRTGAGTEVVAGDLLQPSSLPAAFAGVDTAFYLVHSMQSGKYFEERERESASNFAAAAAAAGVRRIIYLGGLAQGEDLSPHMRSRAATGRILREGSVPVLEFRASIILGSGSASFEVIRALVERLPFMITPRWVAQAAQPVAIEDVIEYLVQGIHHRCDGRVDDVQTRVVVDASGQSTFLASRGAPTGEKHRGRYDKQVAVFSQVRGTVRDPGDASGNTMIFYKQKGHWAWFIPLDDDLVSVGVVCQGCYFEDQSLDRTEFF